MFVVKNAWRNVIRNKGRNILIALIVAIIAAAATIGLAIRQAAVSARESGLEDTVITAQISFDRSKAIGDMRADAESSGSDDDSSDSTGSSDAQPSSPDFDAMRDALADRQLSLADYESYAAASDAVTSTYYTETAALAATDAFQPVEDSSSSSDSAPSSDSSGSSAGPGDAAGAGDGRPSGGMGGGMGVSSGDFSLVGFSSDEAVAAAANGTFTMTDGQVFGYGEDSDGDVIIAKELADFNGVDVGDEITLADASDEDTTYTFTVVGIYENDAASSGAMGGPMASTASDPANAIYTSVSTLASIGLDADSTSSTDTSSDASDSSDSTAASSTQLSYTYVFAGKDDYETFVADVTAAGLDDDYTVSSTDVDQYESSLIPLDSLSDFALTLLAVVLAVGAVVLVTITLFNVRERKYEVGVLTAIGVRKAKVAAQFTLELLIVTMVGLALGAGVGAVASVPVSNRLLAAQVEQQQSQQSDRQAQFGRDMQSPGDAPGSNEGPDASDSGSAGSADSDASGSSDAAPSQPDGAPGGMMTGFSKAADYVSSVDATVDLGVVGRLILIGLGLTLVAALAAVVFVMRYEPLQILADRS